MDLNPPIPETEERAFCAAAGVSQETVAALRLQHLSEPADTLKKKKSRVLTPAGIAKLLELMGLGPEVAARLQSPQGPVAFVVIKRPMNSKLLRVREKKEGGAELLVRCRDNSQFPVGREVCAVQEGDLWRVVAGKKRGDRA